MHLSLDFTGADDPLGAWALVGAGAVGSVLAVRIAQSGYPPSAILSRTLHAAQHLATATVAPVASSSLRDLPPGARLVLCAVPDDALGALASDLAVLPHDWSCTTVLHTSGALGADALAPLRPRGAALGSIHPLQTFPRHGSPEAASHALDGVSAVVEGDAEAVRVARLVARALGIRAVGLAPDAKAQYHLAAALASNALVTLLALVHEVLGDVGISRADATALIRPLVMQTARGALGTQNGAPLPEDVLTGPIARGDAGTLAAHLSELEVHLPHLVPVYAALSVETVRVAVRGGHLAPAEARPLLNLLREAVTEAGSAL